MKIFASLIFVVVAFTSNSAVSCDEQCLKEQAEATQNKSFPKYLTWKECETVATTFMTGVVDSLVNFRSSGYNTKYKGPLKNIRAQIARQKEWLLECDDYLQATNKKRVFENDKATGKIFKAMDSVSKELTAIINGATYSVAMGEDPNGIMNQKFDVLFKHVDDHRTRMHLKGKYVLR